MGHFLTVGRVEDFKPGEMYPFRMGNDEIVVTKLGPRFYAFRNACTHRFEYMTDGFIAGGAVICAYHDAEFDLNTGDPISGPAVEPLPVYVTRVEGDEVQVEWAEALSSDEVAPADHSDEDPLARQFII